MAVGYESTQKTIKIDDDNKLIIANTARQSDGLPRGGRAVGPGLNVKFQTGPVEVEGGRKGAFIEDLLAIVVDRLKWYQTGQFACRENAVALTHIQTAGFWLEERTRDRQERGVEGTYDP